MEGGRPARDRASRVAGHDDGRRDLEKLQREGVFEAIREELRHALREREGQAPDPFAGVMDAGRSSPPEKGVETRNEDDAVDYDAGKLVKGRKLHFLVDTLGLPIPLLAHSAGAEDRDGAIRLFAAFGSRLPALGVVHADGRLRSRQDPRGPARGRSGPHIVRRRSPRGIGFEVLPKRRVVERTFAWIGRTRRLAGTWDALVATMTAFATLAAIRLRIRRLARNDGYETDSERQVPPVDRMAPPETAGVSICCDASPEPA